MTDIRSSKQTKDQALPNSDKDCMDRAFSYALILGDGQNTAVSQKSVDGLLHVTQKNCIRCKFA